MKVFFLKKFFLNGQIKIDKEQWQKHFHSL